MTPAKKIQAARASLIFDHPFFGALALRLRVVEDAGCGTAWTDGTSMGYNPAFIDSLTREEVAGVVAHEVMHCFPAGTIVAGDDKPIEAFSIGDEVVGRYGVKSRVVATSRRQYDGELITIRGRGLLPVDMTSEHPVLVTRAQWARGQRLFDEPQWKPAGDVEVGDWLYVPRIEGQDEADTLDMQFDNAWSVTPQIRNGVTLDDEIAEFIGWYVAEGWTSKTAGGDYRIGLSLNGATERHVAARLAEIIKRRFGYSARIYERVHSNSVVVSFHSAPLGRFLKRNCGAGAKHKRIPEMVLYNKDDSIPRAFLRGYIAGDGHSAGKFVGFGTASKTLALQVQLAFARLGSMMNLYERGQSQTTIRGRVVNSGAIYIGQGRSQAVFDTLSIPRLTARPTRYCGEHEHCLVTPVLNVSSRTWSGDVFNFETEDHTYTAGNVLTHNCAAGHPWRRGGREPSRANIAMDYAINYVLEEAGLKLPRDRLRDRRWDGRSFEWIYARLPDDTSDGQGAGGAGQPNTSPGAQPSTSPGAGGPKPPTGADVPKAPGAGAPDVRDTPSGSDGGQDVSTEAEWRQAVQQAAAAAKARGRLPNAVKRLAGMAATSRVDWRSVLHRFAHQAVRDDYTWLMPNRQYLASGLYLPALHSERVGPIAVAIDTSGSVDRTLLSQFAAELRAVADDVRPERVYVLYCDARVHRVDTFERDDMIELHPHGGGGTDFRPVFRELEKLDEPPVCLIYLTDLDGSFPSSSAIPTLWGATNGERPVPFGEVVVIDA